MTYNKTQCVSRRMFLVNSSRALMAGMAASATTRLSSADVDFDLLIKGGTVIDGSGAKRFRADVAVKDGRIASVGRRASGTATRTLDASSLIVCPGFIDMHSHSDRTLLADGTAQSAVRQGATTHVIGNCGSSPAPVNEAAHVGSQSFRSYGEFLEALRQSGVSLNVCGLVGHNTVRTAVMGVQDRPPTEVEMQKMKDWVAEAMRGGAVGMSTGLVSPPGTYSETEEIIELARVVARHGGIYASHIRGEASTVVDSVREAIEIGQSAKLPVEISHHKAAGRENWGKTHETLPLIEAANREGIRVRVDVYPYRAGSAGLSQLVPPWAHEGGRGEMLSRLEDPKTRKQIVHDMQKGTDGWPNFFLVNWDDIQITTANTKENQKWIGKKIGEVARDRGCSGIDACLDLLIEERGNIGMINFIMDENEVQRVLKHPLSLIGSDGTAVSAETATGMPHPRYYGCFPRVLGHYARDLGLFDLETAVRKMTGASAEQLGLPDRGLVKAGYAADIVLFDPETIIDKATFDAPHQYPEGIDAVIVNGTVVVHRGEHSGARPGKVLPPQRNA